MLPCEVKGCNAEAIECHLWDWDSQVDVYWFYCPDHARENGFCSGCGEFYGGIESFDFDPSGLCENCKYDGDYYDEPVSEYDEW